VVSNGDCSAASEDLVAYLCLCMSWRTYGRHYHIIEFDNSADQWRRLGDEAVLEVSAEKTAWLSGSTRAD
jgi:hypothetical protein